MTYKVVEATLMELSQLNEIKNQDDVYKYLKFTRLEDKETAKNKVVSKTLVLKSTVGRKKVKGGVNYTLSIEPLIKEDEYTVYVALNAILISKEIQKKGFGSLLIERVAEDISSIIVKFFSKNEGGVATIYLTCKANAIHIATEILLKNLESLILMNEEIFTLTELLIISESEE